MTILTLLLICSSLARRRRLSLSAKEFFAPLTETQAKNYKNTLINSGVELLVKLEEQIKKSMLEQKPIQIEKLKRSFRKDRLPNVEKFTSNLEKLFFKVLVEIHHPFTILKELFEEQNHYNIELIGEFSYFVYCISKMSKLTQNAKQFAMELNFEQDNLTKSLDKRNFKNRIRETRKMCSRYNQLRVDHDHNYFNAEHEQLERIRFRFNSYIVLKYFDFGLSDISKKGDFNTLVNKEHACLKSNWSYLVI